MVIAALGGSRLSNLARIFIAMKLKLFFYYFYVFLAFPGFPILSGDAHISWEALYRRCLAHKGLEMWDEAALILEVNR